jgi:drug/metabolite transporter (DMT)-like permease
MLTAYASLAAAQAMVGSSIVVGKVVAASFPVMLASGLTSAIALPILLGLLYRREGGLPRIGGRDLIVLFFQALIGSFLFRILLLAGLALTTAAESGIITSTTPAAIGLISFLFLGDRPTRNRVAGIALAVLGILAMNVLGTSLDAERGPNPLLGNLMIVGVVICEALFTIFGKMVSGRVSPLAIAVVVSLSSLLMFLPFMAHEAAGFDFSSVPAHGWLALVYFGIGLNVVAFVLWFHGVARVPASTAGVFTGLLPVSAVALSYVVLREPFEWTHLIGGLCVLAAIVLISLDRPKARARTMVGRPRRTV